MRALILAGLSAALAASSGGMRAQAADCAPLGQIHWICNVVSPEDFAVVPGTDWMIASGNKAGQGALRAVNVRAKTVTNLYPSQAIKSRPDARAYSACPGPLNAADPVEQSTGAMHGIFLKYGSRSTHTLFAVHHGSRESVEVFELDGGTAPPALTWIGCVVAPEQAVFNAVVGLPEGGLAATAIFRNPAAPRGAGAPPVGSVWEWHAKSGWRAIPGTEATSINGVEISKDGKFIYVAAWGDQEFVRVQRGQTPVKRDVLPMPFRIDNLRSMPDGTLFAAGHGGTALCSCPTETWHVGKIDPVAMKVQELLKESYVEGFGAATIAIQVGREIWIGTNRGDRIGYFPAP